MATSAPQPTQATDRIASLDVVRGVALLGILLLNIVGMGMLSSAYFHPLGGIAGEATSRFDVGVWMFNELFFEGAMRALFSMLFGAGVVLFATSKSAGLHYRRTFWLLIFGLIDGFILLWNGDILVVYAIAGALLYFARNASAPRLFVAAGALIVVLMLLRGGSQVGLEFSRAAHERVVAAELAGESVAAGDEEAALAWLDYRADSLPDPETLEQELVARRSSYVMPIFMLWDALAMMLLGMALYKSRVLQGEKSVAFYRSLALAGITTGLVVNAFELVRARDSNYDLLLTSAFIQPTYDLGRVGLCLGYMALIVWWSKTGFLPGLQQRLSAVGRMALTNYLTHSAVALFLFTGAGFALVGTLERWQLYPVVLVIWLCQLWFSPRWLARHKQGPLEALWRKLTYG